MQPQTTAHSLRVESSAFGTNGSIPPRFTADGDDIAPPLAWSTPPPGTKSIAVLVEDPDAPDPAAPTRTWTHWVVTGLPATTTALAGDRALPTGAVVGKNDWGKRAWGGPNPPIGRHRYFFKVFALDTDLPKPLTRTELLAAIKGHVLAQGELVGTYEAHRRR